MQFLEFWLLRAAPVLKLSKVFGTFSRSFSHFFLSAYLFPTETPTPFEIERGEGESERVERERETKKCIFNP